MFNKILGNIICKNFGHKYRDKDVFDNNFSSNSPCLRCGSIKVHYKTGENIDKNGNDIFILPDGSYIVAEKVIEKEENLK